MGTKYRTMENNIVTAEVIEQQCFLTSEKRLFNRRGSNETSESDDTSKPASLNINAPIFVSKSKTAKASEDEQSASPNQQRKRAKSKRRNELHSGIAATVNVRDTMQ